jgi:hypothetical protein
MEMNTWKFKMSLSWGPTVKKKEGKKGEERRGKKGERKGKERRKEGK